jgi:hypothetical protein
VRTETPNIVAHSASLLPRRSRAHKQGTAGQWINEGKQAVKMTRLSRRRFWPNEVRPWRRLVPPKKIEKCSLTSLQQRLVKTGGRLVKHARYY